MSRGRRMAGESRSPGTGTATSTSSRSPSTAASQPASRARGPTIPSRPGPPTGGAWSSARKRTAEGSSPWTPREGPSGASRGASRWVGCGQRGCRTGATSSFRTPTSRRSTSCGPTAARRLERFSRASSREARSVQWPSIRTDALASSASIGRDASGSMSPIAPTAASRPWIPGSRCRSDGRRRSRGCIGIPPGRRCSSKPSPRACRPSGACPSIL